ncbi:MAG: ABC transporter permease, partial [Dehalococcoidia bacterium]|nr:ABC transporter permease [Dehalococcoidia bacterium]
SLIAAIGTRFYGVGIHLGLRQISRSPGQFTRLVFLLILTFAIGTFSASMAATVDRNISDRISFKIGGDTFFAETGTWLVDGERWRVTPAERHYDLLDESGEPEIQQLARLWNAKANFQPPGRSDTDKITVFGVDPIPFASTVWWREDFASRSLNELMNALALDERAILVDRAYFHDRLLLNIGDPLRINIGKPFYLPDELRRVGERQRFNIGLDVLEFTIAGWIDTFPTHYPEDGPFVVANVDYIHRNFGESPWDIIATLGPGDNAGDLSNRLRALDIDIISAVDFTGELLKTRKDATQIGTFGILTVGFLVSTILTLLGFLTYSFLSFRRHLQEFGVLRAMGLSVRQMIALFVFKNGFLIFVGTVGGTILGIATSALFIPFLQLSVDQFAGTPPFIVEIAWGDIARVFVVFSAIILITLPVSIWMLRRIQIHEAMKFGSETG